MSEAEALPPEMPPPGRVPEPPRFAGSHVLDLPTVREPLKIHGYGTLGTRANQKRAGPRAASEWMRPRQTAEGQLDSR